MGVEEDLFKKRKKSIDSNSKGQRNELALAVALKSWTGMEFHRVPRSGGLGWDGVVAEHVVGDLVCENTSFPFCIETKHYRAIGFKASTKTLRKNSCVFKFWKQAKKEEAASGRIPLLILRENGMPAGTWWVFCNAGLMTILSDYFQLEPKITTNPEQFIYGYFSDDFFKLDYNLLKCIMIK